MNRFEALGINTEVVKAITELGFESPTPIQEQAVPVLLSGNRDLVALAQTGTGKTAAFGLPLAQLIDFTSRTTQALILCPTRELCLQITRDLQNFTKYINNSSVVAIYGGASIENQIKDIKRGAQIIVATPGRMVDMIERGRVDFKKIRFVVLDEADEMLNMGFQEDLNTILSETPSEKNVWLFSATMPTEVARISRKYMTDPFEVTVGRKNQGNDNIEHVYYVVHARDRYATLKRLADYNPDIFAIVFCRTKRETQEVADALIKDGYNADSLHGDLSQAQRDLVMKRYRSRSLQMLVATDVAARGIDVDDVTHVINYNLPDDIENYTHRSGRTARAGKKGVSIVIVNMREIGQITQIERTLGKKFIRGKVPNGEEVCQKQLFHLVNKLHDVEINEKEIEPFLPKANEQLNDLSKEEIIKRFLSIEFNRFIEYYRSAPDLNGESRRQVEGGDRERIERSSNPNVARFFINIGRKDGLDKGSLLRFLCDTSQIEGSGIGRIDVKDTFSFFETDKSLTDAVMNSINGQQYQNRKVNVELSAGAGGGGSSRSSSGGGYRGGDSSGKRSYGSSKSYSGSSSGRRSSDSSSERSSGTSRSSRFSGPRKKDY